MQRPHSHSARAIGNISVGIHVKAKKSSLDSKLQFIFLRLPHQVPSKRFVDIAFKSHPDRKRILVAQEMRRIVYIYTKYFIYQDTIAMIDHFIQLLAAFDHTTTKFPTRILLQVSSHMLHYFALWS